MHKINIETLRSEAKRQLALLKNLLTKAHERGLVTAPAQDQRSRATFDTESLRKVFEVLDGERYKLDHLDMVLAVVGTMKAGKSTSINAIVGAEVLPNRNRPMTTLPTLIRHTLGVLQPRLIFEKVLPLNDLLAVLNQAIKNAAPETLTELERDADMAQLLEQVRQLAPFDSRHEGEQGIFNFLKGLNDLVRLCFQLGVDFPFQEYAAVDAMPVIEVEFSHLKNTPATQGRLTLLDTPGPNEAGQQHLRKMLEDQLQKASAVLVVLDYTQLKSDADAQVRESLLEISGTAKGRMYALVNKFDQKDRNSDDRATVKEYVAQTLMRGELAADSVFPVSANQGYLASRARNEIARNGTLDPQEPWARDFAKEAFGRRWEKCITDSREVESGADELWQESGFAAPLNQVIVEAHLNAALEALRSAASKLDKIARDAGDFFKANVGALKKDTAALQKNIDDLQRDIGSIARIEKTTTQTLKSALNDTRGKIKSSADDIRNEVVVLLTKYFKEGERIEASNQASQPAKKSARRKSEPITKSNDSAETPSIFRNLFSSRKARQADEQQANDFYPNSRIIKFDDRSEANDFRGKIENSIRNAMDNAEESIKSCMQSGINDFSENLELQRREALEEIQQSVQKNVDGLDIEIRLPNVRNIALNTSVSSILKDAVEEKTKTVTRRRRKSGAWGKVCSWFKTDDWGWEDYGSTEAYYQVDLGKISKSSAKGIQTLFEAANSALDNEIHPQLQQGVDEFFGVFREKIEHIRGDLLNGLEKHNLDRGEKAAMLEDSTQLAREASDLGKDCMTLNESTETLRREEGVSAEPREALA